MTAPPSEPDNATTLNALVAEKVMGLDPECMGPLRRTEGDAHYGQYYCRECGQPIAFTPEYFAMHGELPKSHRRNTPNYCGDMNVAMSAIMHLGKPFYLAYDPRPEHDKWACNIQMTCDEENNKWTGPILADNPAKAISLVALKACNVEIEP